ncbi:MAG: tRNA uridine-5-carboxymethylaminomethyl(34) synthesis GTPase MnmE [Fibrobacteres bacterium]|nr:tRNA uridine-5-carboxymethylaminomethyl(34) synthesis GTPase MnmE [Fibrobacterota bacterium]
MKSINNRTIAAIATPKGAGAIAVVRISGEARDAILGKTFKTAKASLIKPRRPVLGSVIDKDGTILDNVILTTFDAPNSYTGENTAEFSCHGSPYITGRILETLLSAGAETALPGEFTQKAFLNGKLDLVQAEAVSALIASDTEKARHAALQQLSGGLSAKYNEIRQKLIELLATAETQIDFSEEELPPLNKTAFKKSIDIILTETAKLTKSYKGGRIISEGFRIALIGPPNAGKSSIFNALCNSERVIVDEHPGTTRDLIEETISIDGYRITIIDTAGIRETDNRIESIGIDRAKAAASESDLILNIIDATQTSTSAAYYSFISNCTTPSINVCNKCDIADSPATVLPISAHTGKGFDALKKAIVAAIPEADSDGEHAIMTSARQNEALRKTETALKELSDKIEQCGEEVIAQYLREALAGIGEITGHTTDDDILNHIFSNFCIGK